VPAPTVHAQPAAQAAPAKPAAPAATSASVIAAEPAAAAPAITTPSPALATELGARAPATQPAAPSMRADPPQRLRGVVQWFGDRGYGFIAGEDGRDIFVHRSAIARGMLPRLTEGQLVEYEVQDTAKGLQAVAVAVAVTPLPRSGQRGQ